MQYTQINTSAIEDLLGQLWDRGGTDIHLSADAPPMFRIDGELYPVPGQPTISANQLEELIAAMLTDEMLATFYERKQVDFSFSWGRETRYRGNAFRERGATSVALRAIPFEIPTPEDLLLRPVMSELSKRSQS